MDWAVDTTYLITDASFDVKISPILEAQTRPQTSQLNCLAETMQPPHPALIETCAAVACPSDSVFCCFWIRRWHRCRRLAIDSGPVPGIRAPWAGCRTLWDWPWDCPWTAWVVHQCYVYRQPTVHRAFALVFCHPPCVLHGRSIETVLSWGKPRCHWFDNVRVHWCWESLSCHLILAIFLKHLRWNWSSFSIWRLYRVHDSQPYSKVVRTTAL